MGAEVFQRKRQEMFGEIHVVESRFKACNEHRYCGAACVLLCV